MPNGSVLETQAACREAGTQYFGVAVSPDFERVMAANDISGSVLDLAPDKFTADEMFDSEPIKAQVHQQNGGRMPQQPRPPASPTEPVTKKRRQK